MNLYRSFGNMLETWVTEGYPALDSPGQPGTEVAVDEEVEGVVPGSQASDAYRSGSRDSLRFSGTTARSESEDSGVELVSASSTCTSPRHAIAVMALKAFGAGQSEEPDAGQSVASGGDHHPRLPTCPSSPALSSRSCPSSPSSTSSSSSCQSIGSNLSPLSAVDSGLRVEQALRRADPTRRQLPRHGLSLAARGGQTTLPRKRSNTTSSGTACSSTGPQESRGQRSPLTTEVQAAGERLHDDPDNRPATQLSNGLQTQIHAPSTPVTSRLQAQASSAGEEGRAEPSPGFLYLEQVCLMLEKFAQLQTRHHSLQTEIEQLRNQQNHNIKHSTQPSTLSQCFSLHTTESVSHTLENTRTQVDEETLLPEEHAILAVLRRRSVSDAGRLTPYRNHRGRSKSIGDLLEEDEEETGALTALRTAACESQEQSKSARQGWGGAKGLKQKITSLRRNEDLPDGRSQTLPRLGKKSSLRGLMQIFKKRSKSSPTPT
ncbi:hypothetical protein AALO_G00165750 [Alosa alosa]|uniref:Uncharacterized protein n=1 Tax=Alosa alosa TaxID=278164 RepID=A0AAV6GD46_9TELE|nr:uncharacterized protein si:dkey-106l3.7 [Alosa alosa]KAG5272454.1 hypothetical protein AALO_G00165750 [Alosa alosa]